MHDIETLQYLNRSKRKNPWIRIKDIEPPLDTRVLFLFTNKNAVQYVTAGTRYSTHTQLDSYPHTQKRTHWMPIPIWTGDYD